MRATRALIRMDHFRGNIDAIRAHTATHGANPLICLAVKADAYGHGIVEIARAAAEYRVDYLAVATAEEGIEVRSAGISLPILLYSLALPSEVEPIVAHQITPILGDEDQIALYGAAARESGQVLAVHVKIDTGMGRIGCRPAEATRLCEIVAEHPSLTLGGVSTHFAGSDMADRTYTENQIETFDNAIENIRSAGIDPGIVHAANSGAVLGYSNAWYDMIRPGIVAYGYPPPDQTPIAVKPVMQLKSRLVYLKQVDPGTRIGYGMTWTASKRTWIGTIPVGYGDGYNRLLSNRGAVSIKGKRYPIAGRICMDQLMIDLGPGHPPERYSEVELFGSPEAPDAAEIAELCDTIPYEVTCAVSRRVPRVYIE